MEFRVITGKLQTPATGGCRSKLLVPAAASPLSAILSYSSSLAPICKPSASRSQLQ
ncbi:hypothetical protein Droror1_Dr00002309, partial [Drosera rotundifolia]